MTVNGIYCTDLLLILGMAGFGQGEYFPYVYYKINIDMVGPASSSGI